MANNENLKPFDSNQSREEAKKNGRKGGIKSFEVIRDTIGEKQSDKIETKNTNIGIVDEKTIESVMNKLKEL